MRSKLKRIEKSQNAPCPRKDRQKPAEVTVLSPPEDRETFSAKHVKIAPIFLHAAHRGKSKCVSDVTVGLPAERSQKPELPAHCEDLLQGQRQTSPLSHTTERRVSWRRQLSPSALHSCLEDIQTSNPAFPVQAVFRTLQKKRDQQGFASTAENSPYLSCRQNLSTDKRKRGSESSERTPKRLRPCPTAVDAAGVGHHHVPAQDVQESAVLNSKTQPSCNKLSRAYRLKQQKRTPAGSVTLNSEATNNTESCSQSLSDVVHRDFVIEDLLWTDKYSPQHSTELIGNSASVNKLQGWLKKWKLRTDRDEKRKMEERKQEENSSDSWDCGDFQGEAQDDSEEPLSNTMLITGPPGVGKTASVYACSQELGFKVFEVNCSSQRSGRHVLSQLKEATQSHLVETSGRDALKPTYFSSYNIKSSTSKSETLSGMTQRTKTSKYLATYQPRSKVSAPLKSVSKRKAAKHVGPSVRKGKANPATVPLANYFKTKAKADHLYFGGPSPSQKADGNTLGSPSPGSDQTAPQNKKTATSLILFEEVDVIFDDDVGFLAAIKTFMTTTKRPVILTTNDPSFRERFSCSLQEIIFKTPSAVTVCSYLQLVALAENERLELDDVRSLLRLCRGDIRRCLLQLQLWVDSGGRRACRSPKELTRAQDFSVTEIKASKLPRCDTSCTVSMLGLHSVSQHQLLNLLKRQHWSDRDMIELLGRLAESWRGGVPLLYSNLELLLPIGAKETSAHQSLGEGTCGGQTDPHVQKQDESVSPQASAANSKPVRNIPRLSRRKYITSPSSCTHTPQRTVSSSKRPQRAPSLRDQTEKNADKVGTDCLEALSDFFDLMSYLDATMPAPEPLVSGSCRSEAFVWTAAEIKDGFLDETSKEEYEEGESQSQDRLLDIQAAVEGLGCHRCCWRMSEAWTEAQKHRQELGDTAWRGLVERLTLPASYKRQGLSFCFQPLCSPSVSRRRYELSRTVLSSDSFSLLGNRRAVSVDYMPILRYVCRFQRAQQEKEEPVRCLNYLSNTHLGLSKSTLHLLAEDFS